MGPFIWDLKAANDFAILAYLYAPDSGAEMAPEIGYSQPRLESEKRAAWSGGGLAAISPVFPENFGPRFGD